MNKKLFLGLGSITAIAAPVAAVVACNSDESKNQAQIDADFLQSKIISEHIIEELKNKYNVNKGMVFSLTPGDLEEIQPRFVKGKGDDDKLSVITYKAVSNNSTTEKDADEFVIEATVKNGKDTATKTITIYANDVSTDTLSKDDKMNVYKESGKFKWEHTYFFTLKDIPATNKDEGLEGKNFTVDPSRTSFQAEFRSDWKLNSSLEEIKAPTTPGSSIEKTIGLYIEDKGEPELGRVNFNANVRLIKILDLKSSASKFTEKPSTLTTEQLQEKLADKKAGDVVTPEELGYQMPSLEEGISAKITLTNDFENAAVPIFVTIALSKKGIDPVVLGNDQIQLEIKASDATIS